MFMDENLGCVGFFFSYSSFYFHKAVVGGRGVEDIHGQNKIIH